METPAEPLPAQSQGEARFRWRGGGVSRIEGLSDGVFALALTLLIVSLEVPRTFGDLLDAFRKVPVFALTYAAFAWIWFLHHRFHRRYGLEDTFTVSWNLVLLFVVLLYVYPLRYLATALCEMFRIVEPRAPLGPDEIATGITGPDMQGLMLLYGAGFVSVFAVMSLLHSHAWRLRDRLGLDARERILTRASVRESRLSAGVGLFSIALACVPNGTFQFLAGISYSLTGAVHGWSERVTEREMRALEADAAA